MGGGSRILAADTAGLDVAFVEGFVANDRQFQGRAMDESGRVVVAV